MCWQNRTTAPTQNYVLLHLFIPQNLLFVQKLFHDHKETCLFWNLFPYRNDLLITNKKFSYREFKNDRHKHFYRFPPTLHRELNEIYFSCYEKHSSRSSWSLCHLRACFSMSHWFLYFVLSVFIRTINSVWHRETALKGKFSNLKYFLLFIKIT